MEGNQAMHLGRNASIDLQNAKATKEFRIPQVTEKLLELPRDNLFLTEP